jgi:hypothetical protein
MKKYINMKRVLFFALFAIISTILIVNLTLSNSYNRLLDSVAVETTEALTEEYVVVEQYVKEVSISEGPTVYRLIDSCHEEECPTVNVSCKGQGGSLPCHHGTLIMSSGCTVYSICQYA